MIETILEILKILGVVWVSVIVLFLAWVIISLKNKESCNNCKRKQYGCIMAEENGYCRKWEAKI